MSNGFIIQIVTVMSVVLTRDWNSKTQKNLQTEEMNSSPTGIFIIILFLNHTCQTRLYRLQYT